jgi:hypothetical protein
MKKIHQFKATWKLIQSKSNRPNTSIIGISITSVFVVIGKRCVPAAIDIIAECVQIAGIIETAFTIVKIVTPDDITTDTSVNIIPKIITDDITTDASIIVMADVTTNAAK